MVVISSILLIAAAQPAPDRVRYRIDATVAPSGAEVAARATVTVPRQSLTAPNVMTLNLRLTEGRRMVISAAGDSTGRTVDFSLSPDSNTVTVPLRPGSGPATAMLEYTVRFDTSSTVEYGYRLAASTSVEEAWYPTPIGLPDDLTRFAEFDLSVTVPKGLTALATGALVDSVGSTEGTQYRWRASEVEGAALAVGTGFRVVAMSDGETVVRALAPLDQVAIYRRIALAAAQAAEWYRTTYGFFPAKEIGVVPGYQRARGGYPLPQVFMIHRGDLSEGFARWITAHELAHYYWGLLVLDADDRLGWLTLGLGIWTDQLYLARTGKRTVAEQWRRPDADRSFEDFAEAMAAGHDQRLGLSDSVIAQYDYDYNTLVRHGKGSIGVYLVARALGDDRFVALQRELLERYRYRRLSVADFAREAEAAGFPGAPALLAGWAKGDGRIDYRARPLGRRDREGRHWIGIERTGTIDYPVTIEVVGAAEARVRAETRGLGLVDSVAVAVAGPIREVRIDPDGGVLSQSSWNAEMRGVFLRAEGAVGKSTTFVTRARAHLAQHPDPYLAAGLIERLFELGRDQEVYRTAQQYPQAVYCDDRVRCFAALQVARSLARTGRKPGARAWLNNIEPVLADMGIAGGRRLADAKREIP